MQDGVQLPIALIATGVKGWIGLMFCGVGLTRFYLASLEGGVLEVQGS